MRVGYLYVLFNRSHRPNYFKVGKTTKSPEERARELSGSTGVPEPFEVHYDVKVQDCDRAEAIVHDLLRAMRINKEFFEAPLKDVIRAIERAAAEVGRVELDVPSIDTPSKKTPCRPTRTESDTARPDAELDVRVPTASARSRRVQQPEDDAYREFWSALLKRMQVRPTRFANKRPVSHYYIGASTGVRGLTYYFTLNKQGIRTELVIDIGDRQRNVEILRRLQSKQAEIEAQFGAPLMWDEGGGNRLCALRYTAAHGSYANATDRDRLIECAVEAMIRLEAALDPHL